MSDTMYMNYCVSNLVYEDRAALGYLPVTRQDIKSIPGINTKPVNLPVISKLDPNDLLVTQLLASFTVIAIPAPFRHFYVETLGVKGSWAGLTAQQFSTFKQRNPAWFIAVRIGFPRAQQSTFPLITHSTASCAPREKNSKRRGSSPS